MGAGWLAGALCGHDSPPPPPPPAGCTLASSIVYLCRGRAGAGLAEPIVEDVGSRKLVTEFAELIGLRLKSLAELGVLLALPFYCNGSPVGGGTANLSIFRHLWILSQLDQRRGHGLYKRQVLVMPTRVAAGRGAGRDVCKVAWNKISFIYLFYWRCYGDIMRDTTLGAAGVAFPPLFFRPMHR